MLAKETRSARWELIVERLEGTFGSIRRLRTIELGSGRGDLSVLLARRGAKATLFDANDRALQLAKSRFDRLGLRADYLQGDMMGRLEGLAGKYDVVLSSGVIEHFRGEDRTRVIATHYEVLRAGGLAVISVPHAHCPPYRMWKFYLERRGWWPYGMELPYTKRELLRRARSVGFVETQAQCLGFWESVSAHWGRSLLKWNVDWGHRRSVLDRSMGLLLLMFGQR